MTDSMGQMASEKTPGTVECPCCKGTGRMVRDPDIGTDQECFCCNGSGQDSDAILVPEYFDAACDKTDWTPREALEFYAAGKHFDTPNGATRILDTGTIASNALKHSSLDYLEMKGDAELSELREQHAAMTKELGELKSAIKDGVDGALWQAHTEREAELASVKALYNDLAVIQKNTLSALEAARAREAKLREAIDAHINPCGCGLKGCEFCSRSDVLSLSEALSLPHDNSALDALVSDAQRWAAISGLMFACQTIELEQTEEGGYRISASEPIENYLPAAWEGDTPEEAIDKVIGDTKQTKPSRIYNSLIQDALAKDANRYDAVRKAFTNGGLMINGEDLADVLFEQGTPEKFDATVDAAINVIIDAARKGE